MDRRLVVAGAILIQLALGAIYSWSVFTKILTDPEGIYRFTATQTAWIFSAGLTTFAAVMVLAGKRLPSVGPRRLTVYGGLLLGLGYVLGGFLGSSFWGQLLTIGVMAGAGIGMAYVVPIAVGVKWFPDKKGLITGLAVAGFGFGAAVLAKLLAQLSKGNRAAGIQQQDHQIQQPLRTQIGGRVHRAHRRIPQRRISQAARARTVAH